ncbi:glycosyltransferase family 4 protein [Vibrio vulnificus]|uniref:glycosyltransferase family 4 protein n=1 Tax=Vibrio vulnificus TaxID=672 RepID=UPI002879DD14|nr:glycosyltransferase family 4 protein [Vibrio vulnificus]EIY9461356.1 glycosyltransferase family 4 protein [Vibrio vulnificus]EJE8668282.1 glycosyltransferase family 4 protein [Vibrio vulnificus]MDS1841979.1 glycosyltransferase family 4 protein [Vibrio vulnificus]MDS1850488.1 glycosyltransferase family 4 protein [Vibrio vulnificus]
MKLTYLHQYFKKPTMNGGVRSYEFAKRLSESGHDVIVVTSDSENSFRGWKIEKVDGFEVHWISVKYDNNFGFLMRMHAFIKFLVLSSIHICKIDSDKLFATSTPLTVAIPALIYKFLRRQPYVFEVRDVWPEVPIALGVLKSKFLISPALLLERLAYKYAESVIALSPDMASSINNRFDNVNVTIIPNASDCHLFNKPVVEDDFSNRLDEIKNMHEFVVFYTGALGFVNNLRYLVDLSYHSCGKVGFVIIGSGREKVELESYAREREVLGKTLYMLPSVSKEQLSTVHTKFHMAVSTVLPIPELYANSANKVFDAFASGTPLLINHGGWLSELINREHCGLVLSALVSTDEYKKLYEFLSNHHVYQKACDSSAKLGQFKFNREVLYHKLCKVLEKSSQ